MGKYDVNFRRFVKISLPISLRTENIISYIHCLLYPIRVIHFQFTNHISETDKKMSYNSQYPNLQRLLNDRFDNANRSIKVVDNGESIDWTLIYPKEELKPIELGLVEIYPFQKYGYQPFTVIVPSALPFDDDAENEMKRMIDTYKFAGTKYLIIRQ